MDLEDLKEMWDKLVSICSKISQKVAYSIFQELLNYLRINKLKKYDKSVMQIFVEVEYLCKCFYTMMNLRQDIWDTIAIIIALKILYNNFDIITTSLLESKNKIINQIFNIL